MSDNDGRFPPFGRGNRTIIRPNPGGRLPPTPASPPSPPSPPQSPPQAAPDIVPPPRPSNEQAPAPQIPASRGPPPAASAPRHGAPPTTHAEEEWIVTPQKPPAAAAIESQGPALRVEELAAPNANPIMRAAGPLLQLLGRLQVSLLRATFATLMEQVAEAIKFF